MFTSYQCGLIFARTYSATDPSENTAYTQQSIVMLDTTSPYAEALADIEVKCCEDVPDPDPSLVRAMDNCSQEWQIAIEVVDTQSGKGCGTTRVREYRVFDACGNSTTIAHTITTVRTGYRFLHPGFDYSKRLACKRLSGKTVI